MLNKDIKSEDYNFDVAVSFLQNDKYQDFMDYVNAHFLSVKNKILSNDKNYVNTNIDEQSLLKQILFKKLDEQIELQKYENAVLIIKCIHDFLEIKLYNNSSFWRKAGICFNNFKSYNFALQCFFKALEFEDCDVDTYREIGDIYCFKLEKPKEAIKFYEKYISFIRTNAYVYNVLGHLYEKIYKTEFLEKQIYFFQQAIKLMPGETGFLRNLAIVAGKNKLKKLFNHTYAKILKAGASHDDLFNYATWSLQNKNFKITHKYMHHRFFKENNPTEYKNYEYKLWNGKDSLKDKIILVGQEQGYGDSVMFIRFVHLLKKLSPKKIKVSIQDSLYNLFVQNFPEFEFYKESDSIENIDFDYQIPLMQLFSIFKITDGTIPLKQGYLNISKENINEFAKKYINTNKFKIGLAFKGNPSYLGDNRDVPISVLAKLTEIENVQIYSLQVNNNEELYKDKNRYNIIDLKDVLFDFTDTCAAIKTMDIIVSTDNIVLNLAGALGVTTYGIFNAYTDYRWYDLDNCSSGWYNSVKVYQAKKMNEWEPVIDKIYSDLNALVKSE